MHWCLEGLWGSTNFYGLTVERAKMKIEGNTVNSENPEENEEHECLWPYLEDFFMYKGRKGDSVQMQCKLCVTSTVISVYKTSASNLKKPVPVRGFPNTLFVIY